MSDYPLYISPISNYLGSCAIVISIGVMILYGLSYTPPDFDYLAVDGDRIEVRS
jgi:hypothetical protein